MKKIFASIIIALTLFTGLPQLYIGEQLRGFRIVDNSLVQKAFGIPSASAAPKTKTIVFLVGSLLSTTAVSSGATTTFSFTIGLPDMVPTSQPIRSAYIFYKAHKNSSTAISASVFTLNKQGGSPQTLTSPQAIATSGEDQEWMWRLDATGAMQTLLGNASGSYAMTFTTKITGPSRIAEGAELYITYDYDPLAPTQVNTAYQFVYATSSELTTTTSTSPNFNFNLPESTVTSTFKVGASSTNQFWIEFRGRETTSTAVTLSLQWDAEAPYTTNPANAADNFGVVLFVQPKTTSSSPNSNHTFGVRSSVVSVSIANPNALAIVTYTFNFSASTRLRKSIQVLLMQSTTTASTATINTTSTINIPESSPSSTSMFLFGRSVFAATSNPGINANFGAPGCSFPSTTAITETQAATNETTGYATLVWDVTANLAFSTNGNKVVCSSFTSSAATNIRGLSLFLNYDYDNVFAVGSRTNVHLSFLSDSQMTAGTSFSNTNIDASIADASTTAVSSWLNAAYDNNSSAGTVPAQTMVLGTNSQTQSYLFQSSGESGHGETFSAFTNNGFDRSVTTTLTCSTSCVGSAAYDVFGQSDVAAGIFIQEHYHWRNNDGSETTATAAASEDNTTTTVTSSTFMRLRLEIANAGDATTSAAFRLEYQKNATTGAWTQLATSSIGSASWRMATSSQVADAVATTDIATSTGGTTNENGYFLAGEVVASSSRNQSKSFVLTGTQLVEVEYAIQPTPNASASVPYYFRVTNASTVLGTYSVYPQITVASANNTPTVTAVVLNGGSSMTLIPNTSTTITVIASTTDPGGAGNIRSATGTIYRTSLGGNCTANNLNCYQIPTSSCVFTGSTSTVTCSANIWYFAESTGNASSSFPSDSWTGAITVTNANSNTATATSTAQNVNVLSAINVSSFITTTSTATLVQTTSTAPGSVTSINKAFGSNVTKGDLIVAGVYVSGTGKTFALSDTRGDVYSQAYGITQVTDGHQIGLFYAIATSTGANTVTASWTGSTNNNSLDIYEFSGISTSTPLDRVATSTGNGSTAENSGTTGVTSQADEVLVSFMGGSGQSLSVTPSGVFNRGNFTINGSSKFQSFSEYQIVSSTAAYVATATSITAEDWSAGIATFKVNAVSTTTVGTTFSYGTMGSNSNTGSLNQSTTVQNAGNSSTTLQISGTALLNPGIVPVTAADAFIDVSSGTVGTTVTTSTLLSGTIGGGVSVTDWSVVATTTGMTFTSHQAAATLQGPVRVGGVTYPVSHTSQAIAYSNKNNFSGVRANLINNSFSNVSVAGFLTFGPPNLGASANVYDLVRIETVFGKLAVLQLNNGNGDGVGIYGVCLHNPTAADTQSPFIPVTPGGTYWYSLNANYGTGLGTLSIFATSTGALIGTATETLDISSIITSVIFGNDEVATSTATTTFENTIIDFTNGASPLGPGSNFGVSSGTIATSSQHYATSTFSFGGAEQALSATPASVSGFKLTAPTTTNAVSSPIFWGLSVPSNSPTGTYSGTITFTGAFAP